MRNFCGSWTRCVLLVFGLICVLSSCAGMRARSAQERYIYDQTAQHRYATPCDRVLPEVRQMLFQDGFSVKTIDTNTMTLETEWLLTDRDEEGTYEERYLIQAEAPTPESCKISTMRSMASPNGVDTARDLPFEWSILQRVDPRSADRILKESEVVYATSKAS